MKNRCQKVRHQFFRHLGSIAFVTGVSILIFLQNSVQASGPSAGQATVMGAAGRQLITLPNGLKVLLIENAKAKKSALSVTVNAGSLDTSEEHVGLAHFVEHVLFLGTQKYPSPKEFDEFIAMSGGRANATTASTRTTYFLEVNHGAFSEAVDRLSQFFISPLFDEEGLAKELVNVNSEYLKNIQDDSWIQGDLLGELSGEHDPFNKTFQGDAKSLKNVTSKDLRQFFDQFYHPEAMTLVMISPMPLMDQEALVRNTFAAIPQRPNTKKDSEESLKVQSHELPVLTFSAQKLPIVAKVNSHGLSPELVLFFRLAPEENQSQDGRIMYLYKALGATQPGSFSEILKRKGLIKKFGFYFVENTARISILRFQFDLTAKGYQHYSDILTHFFGFMKQLDQFQISPAFFEETNKMGKFRFDFMTPPSGMNGAKDLNAQMSRDEVALFPEEKNLLVSQYNSLAIQKITQQLTPKNMVMVWALPQFKGPRPASHYDYTFDAQSVAGHRWIEKVAATPATDFVLPGVNPWIPKLALGANTPTREAMKLVSETENVKIWHSRGSFRNPMASVSFDFASNMSASDPRQLFFAHIYAAGFSHWISKKSYDSIMAGFTSVFSWTARSNRISFSVFPEKMQDYVNHVLDLKENFHLSEEDFKMMKQNYLDEMSLAIQGRDALTRGGQIYSSVYIKEEFLDYEVFESLKGLTYADYLLYEKTNIYSYPLKVFGYGNISESDLNTMAATVEQRIGATPKKTHEDYNSMIAPKPGHPIALAISSEGINNAWLASFKIGANSPQTDVYKELLPIVFTPQFFAEMRTNRGLGYLVQSGSFKNQVGSYFKFALQSDRNIEELSQTVLPWIRQRVQEIKKLSVAEFEQIKKGVLANLQEPPISATDVEFKEMSDDVQRKIKGKVRRQQAVEYLSNLDVVEFGSTVEKIFSADSEQRFSVFVMAKGALRPKDGESQESGFIFTDYQTLKKTVEYVRKNADELD